MHADSKAGPEKDADAATAGVFVVVVGPSGSGKDTLIEWLRARLGARPDVLFVRRTVTRDADASLEDHDSLTREAFARAEAAGAFAVTWDAHGLRYGLPIALADHVAGGGIAIANGSRGTIPLLRQRFSGLVVINLAVEREILAARLAARGRESAEEIAERLARANGDWDLGEDAVTIDNSGAIDAAGEAVLAHLAPFLSPAP